MRYRLASLLMAVPLAACAGTRTTPLARENPNTNPLEALIARFDQAVGGLPALCQASTIEMELDIVEPTFQVHGVYRAERNNRMRIDIYADGKRVFTEAHDGQPGWQMGADEKATPQSPEGTAALWRGIHTPGRLFGLSELIASGAHLELLEPESRAGDVYDVLKSTLSDGFESVIYLDRTTGLITRSHDVRAFHVDNDPTRQRIESIAADFRRVGGILRPFHTTNIDLDTGTILATTTVTAMRTPTRFDDDLFAMPTQP